MTTEPWSDRFALPIPYTVRRARGSSDLSHVVTVTPGGLGLGLWDPARGDSVDDLPGIDGDLLKSIPTADGRGIIRLRDDTGAELGHVWLADLESGEDRDLTPDLPPYTVRGLDVSADGASAVVTSASVAGFELWRVDLAGTSLPQRLFGSPNEAWNGRVSADGRIASIDTTDQNPGVRRFGVTAIDAASGRALGLRFDPPDGTARAIRFSPIAGDDRLLVVSERSGFARPHVWNPRSGEVRTIELPELTGDVHPLDWSPDGDRLLLAHVGTGEHRLLEYDLRTGAVRAVAHPPGSVFQPDIASAHLYIVASHYAADGSVRVTRERFNQPLEVWQESSGAIDRVLPRRPTESGTTLESRVITARDGLASQLWVGRPPGIAGPVPTVLDIHGGPTFVTTDHFEPAAQAWLDEGFAFASLNYRGSVTFGREFREAFLGAPGDGELDDIAAAVDWLVGEGIADPAAIFITGESYGGYLTLLSVAKLPGVFAGGFAFIAMADWALAYADSNPALQGALSWFFGGLPDERPEQYRRSSALTYVESVAAPLFLKSGRHDTRTPPRQMEAYLDALRRTGADFVAEWFDGGHMSITADGLVEDQRTMLRLARKAIAGERWSEDATASKETSR